jgi:glycosyltransferase involved in cell wall biosynthesis
MHNVEAIADLLQLRVITYNRAAELARTLEALATSPFRSCQITILDNHSSDATPDVCAAYRERFPRCSIVRHRSNIGASANYLRALELSTTRYTWVVGDDDFFDFSDCDDVIEALLSDRFDLLSVGSPSQSDAERGQQTTAQELHRTTRYFSTFTFVTGVIFRTDRFDEWCFYKGYHNTCNLYPHFPFVVRMLEQNAPVYCSRRAIVRRDKTNEWHMDHMNWLAIWSRSCTEFIADSKVRKKAIEDFSESSLGEWRLVFFSVAAAKVRDRFRWKPALDIWAACVGAQKLVWTAYFPLFATPAWAYRLLRSSYHSQRKLLGRSDAEKRAVDPFRY